ncbi:MAG: hypothetical protein WBO97_06730, partial [Tepidiformaceae bacterium]
MTLALYGKSRKRQGGLLFTAFMAIMVAAIAGVALIGTAFAHHLVISSKLPTCKNNSAWNLVVSEGGWSSYREAVLTTTDNTTPVQLRYSPYIDDGSGSTTILSANGIGAVHTAGQVDQYLGSFTNSGFTDTSSDDITSSATSLVHSGSSAWNANFVSGKVMKWGSELMLITERSDDGTTLTVTRGFGDSTATLHNINEQGIWVRGNLDTGSSAETVSWNLQSDAPVCSAKIIIKKVVEGQGANTSTLFTANVFNDGGNVANTSGEANGLTFSQAAPRTHTWNEDGTDGPFRVEEVSIPANWAATATKVLTGDADCSSTAAEWDTTTPVTATGGALAAIKNGDVVTVCFKNTYTPPVTPSVTVDKANDSDGTPNLSQSFNYTLKFTVANGPTTSSFVAVDAIPSNFTVGTVSPSAGTLHCAKSGNTVTCTLDSGAATGSYTATIPVTVKVDSACTEVTNSVYKDSTTAGTLLDSDTVDITGCGHLTFEKLDGVKVIDSVQWTLKFTNTSTVQQLITVHDANTTFVSETCVNDNVADNPGADDYSCTVAGGGTAEVVVSTPLSAGQAGICDDVHINNTAYVVGGSSDTAEYSDTAKPDKTCLTVTKSASQTEEPPTWTISIASTADAPVGVFIKDAGATYQGVVSGGTCTASVGANMTNGIACTVNANSTLIVTVTKPTPAATCKGTDVSNTAQVWVGAADDGEPDFTPDGGGFKGVNSNRELCTGVIQLCKVWAFNAPLELSDGKANFDFTVNDTPVTIFDVVEGATDPECVTLDVTYGNVTIAEQLTAGFNAEGWELQPTNDSGSGGTASFYFSSNGCYIEAPALTAKVANLVRQALSIIAEVPQGEPLCTITFTNTDDE